MPYLNVLGIALLRTSTSDVSESVANQNNHRILSLPPLNNRSKNSDREKEIEPDTHTHKHTYTNTHTDITHR